MSGSDTFNFAEAVEEYVCNSCINEGYLSEWIRQSGSETKCTYCGAEGWCVNLGDLAERVDAAFRENYGIEEPYRYGFYAEPEGELLSDLLQNLLEADESVVADLIDILEYYFDVDPRDGDPPFYQEDSCYIEIPIQGRHTELWLEYCDLLKHGARFFSREAQDILDDIFSDLSEYKSESGERPVKKIGGEVDGISVFRARRARSDDERMRYCLKPDVQLGPPPPTSALSGRLNPAGMPIFYGCFERETCLPEIRLAVGEEAVSCEFKLTNSLTALDLSVLSMALSENIPSIFDEKYADYVSRLDFIRTLEDEVSKVVPPSAESLEYIPTQALGEYLASKHDPRIDCLIYKSSQTMGKNIAIFNHACGVQQMDTGGHEPSTGGIRYRTYVHYMDGEVPDTYNIFATRAMDSGEGLQSSYVEHPTNWVTPNLEVVPDSLRLHRVQSISVDTDELRVRIDQEVLEDKDAPF